MEPTTQKGIHHITALCGDAQRNIDFYVKTLGMRLVKRSVNQDDPDTYHFFYGNSKGDPGSGLTFFPWPMARQGKPGVGEAMRVALAVPPGSIDFWVEHLAAGGIDFDGPYDRFGQKAIGFRDPDLMQLELVFDERVNGIPGWEGSTLPTEHGIRGFRGTTMRLLVHEATAEILEEIFGFRLKDERENMWHYTTDAVIGGSVIIEKAMPNPSANGRGIIHHVAFRAADDEELEKMRKQVMEKGLSPTPIIDRYWFHSVYFRSPGGVLFEIATDGPGYDVDEDPAHLGEKLILPPWLEPQRETIEKRLPAISL